MEPGSDPRAMAGEYRVQWIVDTTGYPRRAVSRAEHFRLFLWPTSMRDSSSRQHIGPAPNDTVRHPLYGVMVLDSGEFDTERIRQLRAGVDPIYPPVLLLAGPMRSVGVGRAGVLLWETVGNRRDGVISLDGTGMGMWVMQASANAFAGRFDRWGIALTDSGHFCASRLSK
ncbi:MAG: hypothetical protein ACRENK_02570 [Gemmatimonadaceae bacterium]